MELEEALEQIGRLTFDIGCMKRDLEVERKNVSEKQRKFAIYLEELIKIESVFPIGSENAQCLLQALAKYNEMVMK